MQEQLATSWQHMVERLTGWLDATITNLPNFILAITIFGVSYWLSGKLRNWLQTPLKKIISQDSIRNIASIIISTFVVAFGLFLALGILNLDTVLKSLLAGAGVAGLAVGLALQGALSNSFSGIFLSLKDIINVGDFIVTNGYSGRVEEITLRNTKIVEPDNNVVIIPNRMVLENPFKNYGLTKQVRVTVECGVGYESDLEEVKDIAINAIDEYYPVSKDKEIEFHYLEFGGSSINFQMRFWVDATSKLTMLEAKSKAIMVLKAAFDEHNINIPFPIRTLKVEKPTVKNIAHGFSTN